MYMYGYILNNNNVMYLNLRNCSFPALKITYSIFFSFMIKANYFICINLPIRVHYINVKIVANYNYIIN